MSTAIIVHGTPSKEEFFNPLKLSESNKHWIPWLQKQLLINDIFTWTPEMPKAYSPDYKNWQEEFGRYPVNEDSLLVGHSCGGGFLLRWLSENRVKIKRVILVAPWLDPHQEKGPEFFSFKIDPEIVNQVDLHLFTSNNDSADVLASVEIIKKDLPLIQVREFPGLGHFCQSDLNSEKFPELLDLLLM